MSMKESKTNACCSLLTEERVEGVDTPFGPPPKEYRYRCSRCNCELLVNEAIIDVEIGIAEFEVGMKGSCRCRGAPIVIKKQWNMRKIKSPTEGH